MYGEADYYLISASKGKSAEMAGLLKGHHEWEERLRHSIIWSLPSLLVPVLSLGGTHSFRFTSIQF